MKCYHCKDDQEMKAIAYETYWCLGCGMIERATSPVVMYIPKSWTIYKEYLNRKNKT